MILILTIFSHTLFLKVLVYTNIYLYMSLHDFSMNGTHFVSNDSLDLAADSVLFKSVMNVLGRAGGIFLYAESSFLTVILFNICRLLQQNIYLAV